MRGTKKNNGITLIALIITIIVMLILVGVSISMVVNGGLFEYAGKAVGDTEAEKKKEEEIATGGIEVDGVWYNSLEDVANNKPASIHRWTRGEGENIDKFTCSHCEAEYKMGDRVDLGIVTLGETIYKSSQLGMAEEDKLVTGDNVSWVVLGIEDTDKDGINETLLVTSRTLVGLREITENEEGEKVVSNDAYAVYMKGAAAYNNGPEELDRMCREIYSNTYGEARSMTIEDVYNVINYIPKGECYELFNGSIYTAENLTTKLKNLPEEIWNKIKNTGTYTPDGVNKEEALGEYELNGHSNLMKDKMSLTSRESEMIFVYDGSSRMENYWLASRTVSVYLQNDMRVCRFFRALC